MQHEPASWCPLDLPRSASRGGGAGRGGSVLAEETWIPAGMRRELSALEDKFTRQVLRLQEQSERFVDIMLRPLETKVASIEAKQPVLDVQLAELSGGLKGLQDSAEAQAQRVEGMETRFRRWRKLLEDDLVVKQLELKQDFAKNLAPQVVKLAARPDVVSHDELLEVVDLLKQELRMLVAEAVPLDGEIPATRRELGDSVSALRQQVVDLERQVIHCAAPAQQEISHVAESLRRQLALLAERPAPDTTSAALAPAVAELERALDRHRRALAELVDRAAHSEQLFDDSLRDLRHLREEVSSMKGRELSLESSTRADAQRIAEQVFDRLWQERSEFLIRSLPAVMRGSGAGPCPKELAEKLATLERQTATLAVMLEAGTVRLDALEERQTCLRKELGSADLESRLDRTSQALEEEAGHRAQAQRQLEELQLRAASAQQAVEREAAVRARGQRQVEELALRVAHLERSCGSVSLRSRPATTTTAQPPAPQATHGHAPAGSPDFARLGGSPLGGGWSEATHLAESLAASLRSARSAADDQESGSCRAASPPGRRPFFASEAVRGT